MGTYVVGDIHGSFEEWILLKEKIEKEDSEAQFILVGDIIDRGLNVFEMLMWAMKNITPDGKYQMILGNHEDMKIKWLEKYFGIRKKKKNFNMYCMEPDSYDFHDMCLDKNLNDQQLREILDFFRNLPYYKEFDIDMGNKKQHFIVVHGGLVRSCLNKDETFSKRSIADSDDEWKKYDCNKNKEEIIWKRDRYGYPWLKKTIVVHGHTTTLSSKATNSGAVPGMIHYMHKCINVDCGAVFRSEGYKKANLAAIRLEDLKEFYAYEPIGDTQEIEEKNIKMKARLLLSHRELAQIRRKEQSELRKQDRKFDWDNMF